MKSHSTNLQPTLVNDASLKLGKRKVDQVLIPDGSPESQRVFKQPRIQDPPGKDVTSKATVVHIDPSKSIINSPPHVVAQSFAKLPYGAQYEITRLVNNGRANYADFLSLISDLTSVPALSTNTTVAPLVSKILKTIKAVLDDAKVNADTAPVCHFKSALTGLRFVVLDVFLLFVLNLTDKGLLVEDIGDDSDDPVIYLAPSQIKIKYLASDDDPAHRAIDVLRASHLKTPCQLSSELVVNLAENGVPLQAFVDLLRASLDEAISPLLDWDRDLGEFWRDIQHRGGVLNARLARERPGIARVQGWSERDAVEQNNDDEDGLKELDGAGANSEQRSLAWWADPISGLPSPLEETIIEALDSGFTPKNCPYLRAKLGNCIVGYVDRIVSSYHIDVPMSCTSMIVPDRSGVLAEGEVFVKASGRYLQLPDGTYTDILVNMDVLVGRHPCKLPTDIRKWKAVDKPEFHSLGMADVIVLSTKGSRRAADWLAGGDYDGDKVLVVWQPELVEPFRNADERYADPPSDMDSRFFQKEVERVSTFSEKTAGLPEIEKIHELQYHLLGALRNTSLVGRYSNYHDIAVYQKGYKHPETRRLAIMFCTVLDSVKSGLSVKPEVLMDDQRRYGTLKAPLWTESIEKGNSKIQSPDNSNSGYPERGKGLKPFIMDGLFKRGKELRNEWKGKIERKTGLETSFVMDPDLVAPYQEFERMAAKEVARRNAADEASGPGVTLSVAQSSSGGNPSEEWSYANDLILIRKHVEEIYKEHKEKIGQAPAGGGGRPSSSLPGSDLDSAALTGLPIQRRQDILRSLSRKFAMYPTADELHLSPGWAARVKASYAYFYDCGQQKNKRKWTQFPWNVAFRDLCDIKAQVDSGYKTVRRECFYDRMAVKALIGRLTLN
ncbi:hypothetical protein EST38_g10748 [Candolleomyces aberdarensis]|uniref:RNA-dependent RNA polymerase n=1 Tax=Candolleomyces aberdarensis TaxID=2316362 RepID=A0A4Q2D8V3_9AGAR|nr:hypothetical protein EST38_g10748 [Candolleomyces aberdarensis]